MGSGLILFLPSGTSDMLPWWLVRDGAIAAHGRMDANIGGTDLPDFAADDPIMALVSAGQTAVRWTDMGDLPAPQAEAAACLKIAGESLGAADGLHIVAAHQPGGSVLVCSMAKTDLQYGLDGLHRAGLNPDVILPAALAIAPSETELLRADLGDGAPILRGEKLASIDEPGLRNILAGQMAVGGIDEDALHHHLLTAFATPPMNLRRAAFAKRRNGTWISLSQLRILGWMLLAALLLSLTIEVATYWQYRGAVMREDARMLAAVRKIAPQAGDAQNAEAALDKALGLKGRAASSFITLSSALFAELQNEREASLRDMRYNRGGTLAFNLAAPTADPINRILLALQAQGYKVTATSRQDTSGLTIAEITIRIP